MTVEGLEDRINAVFQRAIRVSADRLSDQTRRGQLEEWDSLGHLMIIQALQEEFNVEISPEQALDLETIEDIRHFVTSAGGD